MGLGDDLQALGVTDWRLNERHYGALTGMLKSRTNTR